MLRGCDQVPSICRGAAGYVTDAAILASYPFRRKVTVRCRADTCRDGDGGGDGGADAYHLVSIIEKGWVFMFF